MRSALRRMPSKNVLVATTLLFVSALPSTASAYCRARACDPSSEDCGVDAHGCPADGKPLGWKDGEVELLVDEAGSVLRDLSGRDTLSAIDAALSAWMSVECDGGGHPA